jgi:hypothetical protein
MHRNYMRTGLDRQFDETLACHQTRHGIVRIGHEDFVRATTDTHTGTQQQGKKHASASSYRPHTGKWPSKKKEAKDESCREKEIARCGKLSTNLSSLRLCVRA